MGQDDPPNYDTATLVAVPLDGLEPLKHLAAFQVRFSAQLSPTQLKTVGDVQKLGIQSAGNAIQEATTDADNFLSLTQRGK